MMIILILESYVWVRRKRVIASHNNLTLKRCKTYKCSKSSNAALTFKCYLIICNFDAIKHFLQTIHCLYHKIEVEHLSKFSWSCTNTFS